MAMKTLVTPSQLFTMIPALLSLPSPTWGRVQGLAYDLAHVVTAGRGPMLNCLFLDQATGIPPGRLLQKAEKSSKFQELVSY